VVVLGVCVRCGRYLVEVHHDVALGAHAADHVLQGQRVVDPRGLRHVQVVGLVLVPLPHRRHHAVLVRADDVQVLARGDGKGSHGHTGG